MRFLLSLWTGIRCSGEDRPSLFSWSAKSCIADQPFWAQQVYKLGVAPKPIKRSALNEKCLSYALRIAVNDKGVRKKAQELGHLICREDGIATAIDIIHQRLGIKK